MIDPEKLIKSLISSKVKGKKSKSSGLGGLVNGKTLLLGLGAAGAAYMAHRHFVAKDGGPTPGAPPPSTPSAPLPPPPMSSIGSAPSPAPALPPAPAPAAPVHVAPVPAAQAATNPSVFLVKAMIAAANADHEIDEEEKRRILAKCEVFALDPDERALLQNELEHPMSLRDVIITARQLNVPPRQVYAASFLSITADTAAERAYLRKLAEGLGLSESEAAEMEAALGG